MVGVLKSEINSWTDSRDSSTARSSRRSRAVGRDRRSKERERDNSRMASKIGVLSLQSDRPEC